MEPIVNKSDGACIEGKVKKYMTLTYGCQMNEHDTEIMAGMVEQLGYISTSDVKNADLILINTCSVRESAENKIYGKIGELKRHKKENPDLIIGITGCMAQKDRDRITKRAPHVDLVLGTHNVHRLPELIAIATQQKKPLVDVFDERLDVDDFEYVKSAKREGKTKAWVNIMYGCNNFCTYCIVPYVRGREKSRPLDEIVNEVQHLGKEGFKEITLLGQNVNSYGKDLNAPLQFADLLMALNKVEGVERIRYMTSHPRDFTDKLIDVIKKSSKVCEHFHLPIQSGCDRILEEMNRGYTVKDYTRLVEKIRVAIPNASITTDIIVGFPGETEEDFRQTLDLVKAIRFDQAYTFLYSKRSGTPAAEFANQIAEEDKKMRLQELMKIQNEISLEINKAYLNTQVEVLVEGESKTDTTKLTGRTRTNKIVVFPGSKDMIGSLVLVDIQATKTWTLEGVLPQKTL